MGSQFASQFGNLLLGKTVIHLIFIRFLILYLLYWRLASTKDGGSKGFCFLSWHFGTFCLVFNALDSGSHIMVPGIGQNEILSEF